MVSFDNLKLRGFYIILILDMDCMYLHVSNNVFCKPIVFHKTYTVKLTINTKKC